MVITMEKSETKTNENPQPLSDKEMLDYYVKIYEMLSDQRMQTVNFYITIVIGLFGGLFVLLKLSHPIQWAECAVSAMITLISITFYGLDMRTRMLLRNCRRCIKVIESRFRYGAEAQLMTLSENIVHGLKIKWSYSNCLSFQFLIIGISGLILLILSIFNLI